MKEIRIQALCKAYGGKQVLKGLNLTIPGGKTTAILAPSGFGKTTLLRCLMGLEKPDSGTIEGLDGVRISAVFQEDRLCGGFGAAANLRLCAPELTDAQVKKALEAFALGGTEDKPVSAFSGGMKRRVALARALLYDAPLLVLDEPFKGLDPETRALAIARVREQASMRPVLAVIHDEEECTLLNGRIVHLNDLQEG